MATVLQSPARPIARSTRISLKYLFGMVVVLGVIGFVLFSSFQSNTVYYYTLPELQAQRTQLTGRIIRVNAPLNKASIRNDSKNLILQFNLEEDGIVLPIVYRGVVPDTLGAGESVVAEGKLDANGVFQADTILVKCPSKYEQADSEG